MPSSVTCPDSGSQNRWINWITVVLPAPEGPTRATVSPGWMVRLTFSNAETSGRVG